MSKAPSTSPAVGAPRRGWLAWLWHTFLAGNLHFPPPSGKAAELLLLVLPGYGKGPESYADLARAIQAACAEVGLQVHVAIGKYVLNVPKPSETEALTDTLITEFTTRYHGSASAPVFIAAHSAAAMFISASALRVATGVVFLAAIQQFTSLPLALEFPKPMLTLVGSLDRLASVPKAAALFGRLQPLTQKLPVPVMAAFRPVVVFVGLAHMCFADRKDTWAQRLLNYQGGHPDPSIALAEAHKRIAAPVAAFVKVNLKAQDLVVPTDPDASPELRQLMEAAEQTRGWLAPIAKIVSDEGLQEYAEYCARRVAGLPGTIDPAGTPEKLLGTVVTVLKEPDVKSKKQPSFAINCFIYSKPFVQHGVLDIFAYIRPCPAGKGLYTPRAPGLALKMKSRDAMAKALQVTDLGPAATGSVLNEAAFSMAFNSVPEWARGWYKLHGIPVKYLPDTVCPKAPEWVQDTDVELRYEPEGSAPGTFKALSVRSPTVQTNVNLPPRFAGMHYMKVWTPAQALEWLLIDGLRSPTASTVSQSAGGSS